MKRPAKILFYVQHLLGVGHIKRASLLVQGWLSAGFEVIVVSGGEPVPQFGFGAATLVQLPPVKARDARFSGLVDQQGNALTETFKQQRLAQLLGTLQQVQPDLLVIENYPFGRRQLRWELKPLLRSAWQLQQRPKVVCSIRDILQARSAERIDETLALVDQYFDAVMVHGDPGFIPLIESFPRAAELKAQLFYSGYVCEPPAARQDCLDRPEVLVSAGGGAVGFRLLECCLQALLEPELRQRLWHSLSRPEDKNLSRPEDHFLCWRLLLGPNLSEPEQLRLQQLASGLNDSRLRVILEPLRSDFVERLRACRLSISQGGYNTLMDLFGAGCRSLIVPFEGEQGSETEQLMRSQRLHHLGHCGLLRESALAAQNLVEQIEQTLSTDQQQLPAIDCRGAEHSAQLLQQLVACDD